MKISDHFAAEEFVPKAIIDQFGANARWFIDPSLVAFCEWLRAKTGKPVYLNDWAYGGNRDSCGYRLPDDRDGAKLSQHKFKGAIDPHVPGYTGEELRNIVRENYAELHEKFGITTIEKDTSTWLHVDKRWTGLNHLLEVPFK